MPTEGRFALCPWEGCGSHVLEAYFCECDQSREHTQLNVLNADKSSSLDENLFSEAANSFRAKYVEWRG